LKKVAVCVTLAATQTTIDLEFGERDRFAFGPCRGSSLEELVDQEMGMAFVPSMTAIDCQNLHFHSFSIYHIWFIQDPSVSYAYRTFLIEFRGIGRVCQEKPVKNLWRNHAGLGKNKLASNYVISAGWA